MRVEAVHDDDRGRRAGMEAELAEKRGAVARREADRREPRRPRRRVWAARNRAGRVVLGRGGVEDACCAERRIRPGGDVVRLVRLGEDAVDRCVEAGRTVRGRRCRSSETEDEGEGERRWA